MSCNIKSKPRRDTYHDTYGRTRCVFGVQFGVTSVIQELQKTSYRQPLLSTSPGRSNSTFVSSQVASVRKGTSWLTPEMDHAGLKNTHYVVTHLEKPLYTVPETAVLLSVSPQTVYKFINTGQLLAVYPTSKARIPAKSIVSFVENLIENRRLDDCSRKRAMA